MTLKFIEMVLCKTIVNENFLIAEGEVPLVYHTTVCFQSRLLKNDTYAYYTLNENKIKEHYKTVRFYA